MNKRFRIVALLITNSTDILGNNLMNIFLNRRHKIIPTNTKVTKYHNNKKEIDIKI